jgi:hypothetical protein
MYFKRIERSIRSSRKTMTGAWNNKIVYRNLRALQRDSMYAYVCYSVGIFRIRVVGTYTYI